MNRNILNSEDYSWLKSESEMNLFVKVSKILALNILGHLEDCPEIVLTTANRTIEELSKDYCKSKNEILEIIGKIYSLV